MALFSDSKWYGQNQFSAIDTCRLSQVRDFKSEMSNRDDIPNINRELFNNELKEIKNNAEINHQLDFIEK